eukprot:scaffold22565_cov97-Cylindrotheca_fusiformis.AAC.3
MMSWENLHAMQFTSNSAILLLQNLLFVVLDSFDSLSETTIKRPLVPSVLLVTGRFPGRGN